MMIDLTCIEQYMDSMFIKNIWLHAPKVWVSLMSPCFVEHTNMPLSHIVQFL